MQAIRQKMPLPGSDPKDSDSSDFHMNFCYIFIVSVYEMYVKLFYIFLWSVFRPFRSFHKSKIPDRFSFRDFAAFYFFQLIPRSKFFVILTFLFFICSDKAEAPASK